MNRFTKFQRNYLMQMFEDASGNGAAGDNGASGGGDGQKSDDGKAGDNGAQDGKSGDNGASGKNADEKKYSDADLDKIINQKFAKWQKDQEKAVDEAKKLATMTEQEKAEHERDEIKKELEALKKANNMAEMGKQARKLLSDDGINVPDGLVEMIITDNAETTKTNVEAFSKLF